MNVFAGLSMEPIFGNDETTTAKNGDKWSTVKPSGPIVSAIITCADLMSFV